MKNLKSILTSIVTLTLAITIAVSALVPITADAATKRKTVTAKVFTTEKEVPVIKKTGYYMISAEGSLPKFWSFKAPKAGTYYFKLDSLKSEGGTVEKSYCDMTIAFGKNIHTNEGLGGIVTNAWYGFGTVNGKKVDYEYSLRENTCDGTPHSFVMASPDRIRALAWIDKYGSGSGYDYEKAAKLVDSYLKKSGSAQSSFTIKCKLKKGETVYFRNYFKANASVFTETSGEYNLKIVCK